MKSFLINFYFNYLFVKLNDLLWYLLMIKFLCKKNILKEQRFICCFHFMGVFLLNKNTLKSQIN